jgi:predicted 3-demethylubiquinone-9 3-methyltransferase (glyoxalase superfamily)
MSKITPCLWFDGNAEEAANFYASLFPDSHIDAVQRAPSDYPAGIAGDVLIVEFTLMGQPFTALNGGPVFQFNEAISFQLPVETQADADRFADALSASVPRMAAAHPTELSAPSLTGHDAGGALAATVTQPDPCWEASRSVRNAWHS